MRYTVLEMTQRILESMSSDEVNSINDTEESMTVANIIKECYFDIVGKLDLPEKESIYQLTPSNNSAQPCLMYLPTTALDLDTLNYNVNTTADPDWWEQEYLNFSEFMARQAGYDVTATEVGSMVVVENGQSFRFKYLNDRGPRFYTTFNDRTILFDAYDSALDSTLVSAKTLVTGALVPIFTLSDNYTPDLDARQFQLLLQSAKATASVEIRQVENPIATKKERKNEILAQRTKHNIDKRPERFKYLGYGR